jgi:hypothetical protein
MRILPIYAKLNAAKSCTVVETLPTLRSPLNIRFYIARSVESRHLADVIVLDLQLKRGRPGFGSSHLRFEMSANWLGRTYPSGKT